MACFGFRGPGTLVPSACPTFLTGLKMNFMEWERKFESADLEKHKQFLQEAQLPVCDHPLEATAWENGFVPEARGIPSDQLEFRIQGILPPLPVGVEPPPNRKSAWQKKLRGEYHDVKNKWLAFDPQLYHCVEEVKQGARRSLALFTPKNWRRIPVHFLEELIDTGFYPPYLAQSAEASADALRLRRLRPTLCL